MKKISAILLALIMMLSMVSFAAEETFSITITDAPDAEVGTDTEETYKAYKIFDATYEGTLADGSNVSYTISSDSVFYPVIRDYTVKVGEGDDAVDTKVFELSQIGDTKIYNVTKKVDYNAADLAVELEAAIGTTEPDGTDSVAENGEYKIEGLVKGYYIVTSTLGSQIIVETLDNVTIASKNEYPSVEKIADTNNASIGATITYTVTVNVPETVDKAITVTDTMETGLTLVAFDAANAYAGTNTNNVLTWTIPATAAGTEVVLKYTAYINTADGDIIGDAVSEGETDTNDNTVYIEYSEFKSVDVTVEISTYKASFKKVNSKGQALEGVTFQLTDEKGTVIDVVASADGYRVADAATKAANGYAAATITTDANGEIVINGLGNGKYKLVELETLPGYNKLTAPVSFEIKDANNLYAAATNEAAANNEIVNLSGSELPSTGGIGTTIFYTVGGLMMAAAIVLLVAKKKVAASK